jgi:plastocyanin
MSPALIRYRLLLFLALFAGITALAWAGKDKPRLHVLVAVPEADRFVPFALTIRAGDTVEWINNDEDPHTIVSDDAVNTMGPKNVDEFLPVGATFRIKFQRKGQWVYYCRFHSHLDEENQPVAPGPDGGIQGEKDPSTCDPAGSDTCNFGTPMMGVITVLPRHGHDDDGGDED